MGEDEELIPHDMAAIGLAMPAAWRHAHIHTDGMEGGLQEMKDVQPELELRSVLCGVDADIALLPELMPGTGVGAQKLVEVVRIADELQGLQQRLGDGVVLAMEISDGLLNVDRAPLLGLADIDCARHAVFRLGARGLNSLALDLYTGARSESDLAARLSHAAAQHEDGAIVDVAVDSLQMLPIQLAIARHAPIYHAAVKARAKRHRARPVLRRHGHGECGEMRAVHRAVSYTHLRAHETDSYLVCRLL